MSQYFIRTFKIKDGEVFNFDLEMLRSYLPEGVAFKGGAKPTFSFSQGELKSHEKNLNHGTT